MVNGKRMDGSLLFVSSSQFLCTHGSLPHFAFVNLNKCWRDITFKDFLLMGRLNTRSDQMHIAAGVPLCVCVNLAEGMVTAVCF